MAPTLLEESEVTCDYTWNAFNRVHDIEDYSVIFHQDFQSERRHHSTQKGMGIYKNPNLH